MHTHLAWAILIVILQTIKKLFPNAELYEGYGSTEAGLVTLLHPEEQDQHGDSVGREMSLQGELSARAGLVAFEGGECCVDGVTAFEDELVHHLDHGQVVDEYDYDEARDRAVNRFRGDDFVGEVRMCCRDMVELLEGVNGHPMNLFDGNMDDDGENGMRAHIRNVEER